MYHLINRVYLDVDDFKINKSNFYIASEAMAEKYGDGNSVGPTLLGIYRDDEQFVKEGFLELLKKHENDDTKIIIYVSKATYLALVSMWVRSIFLSIDDEQAKALVYFEYLRLYFDGLKVPGATETLGEIATAIQTTPSVEFRQFVFTQYEAISMEYKILLYLKGVVLESLANDVRLFAERSSQHFVIDTQRNLRSMFYNQVVQNRYGYDAKAYVGRLNVLPLIGKFKIITDPSLANRLRDLSRTEIDNLVEDVGLYLNGISEIQDTQRKAERSKLELISNVVILSDSEVIDRFIQILRTSNEHTDYLDWNDIDMLNIPLIQYLISLTDAELQGF